MSNDTSGKTVIFPGAPAHSQEQLILHLRDALRLRVQEAWLFGSTARNEHNSQSDLDLMLIKETSTRFIERADEFADIAITLAPCDILVYTPGEYANLIASAESSGFWTGVSQDRVRII